MYTYICVCAYFRGLVLIRGQSSDGTGADSNGSGKVLSLPFPTLPCPTLPCPALPYLPCYLIHPLLFSTPLSSILQLNNNPSFLLYFSILAYPMLPSFQLALDSLSSLSSITSKTFLFLSLLTPSPSTDHFSDECDVGLDRQYGPASGI